MTIAEQFNQALLSAGESQDARVGVAAFYFDSIAAIYKKPPDQITIIWIDDSYTYAEGSTIKSLGTSEDLEEVISDFTELTKTL